MPLQIRRGTEAERQTLASPLVSGELLWITDDQRLYIGDGVTLARDLSSVTGYNAEDAKDDAASLFTSGTHSGIAFVFDDANDKINATVSIPQLLQNLDLNSFDISGTGNLSITGNISSTGNLSVSGLITGDFKGTISADDSTILVDAVDARVNLDGTVKGDIVPDQSETYDIGSSSRKFKDLYLSGSSLFLGDATITATGTAINLPSGSTVGGIAIGSGTGEGVIEGSNYKINIVADDSTVLLNSSTGEHFGLFKGSFFGEDSSQIIDGNNGIVTAQFQGNLNGNTVGGHFGPVTGNVVGNVTGNVAGNVTGSLLGDVKGSVFADDSSILVDAVDRKFLGILDTGVTVYGVSGITSPTAFLIGDPASPIQTELWLDENLQIRSIISNGGFITSTMSRGTHSSPEAVQAGDELGGLLIRGYTDSSTSAIAGIINFFVDPTAVIAGGNFVKSQVIISAATDTGQDPNDALFLDSAGVATSNAFTANKFFQLPVFADDTARSTAIPTPAAGMMIFMTSGTTPAATNKMQLFDGSNWVNLN